jgi:hypothetical protein
MVEMVLSTASGLALRPLRLKSLQKAFNRRHHKEIRRGRGDSDC